MWSQSRLVYLCVEEKKDRKFLLLRLYINVHLVVYLRTAFTIHQQFPHSTTWYVLLKYVFLCAIRLYSEADSNEFYNIWSLNVMSPEYILDSLIILNQAYLPWAPKDLTSDCMIIACYFCPPPSMNLITPYLTNLWNRRMGDVMSYVRRRDELCNISL